MKKSLFIYSLIALFAIGFIACEKEEEIAKPTISVIELGHENSKMVSPGEEFHIDIEIIAEGKIQTISLELHAEEEHKSEGHWEIDTTFTEFEGLKNADFHKHFDVDSTAELGHYHFHFEVVDMEGNQSVYEDEIEVITE